MSSRCALFHSSFPGILHPSGDLCVYPFATGIANHSGSWWNVRVGAGRRLDFRGSFGLGSSVCLDSMISSLLGLSLLNIAHRAACGRVL